MRFEVGQKVRLKKRYSSYLYFEHLKDKVGVVYRYNTAAINCVYCYFPDAPNLNDIGIHEDGMSAISQCLDEAELESAED